MAERYARVDATAVFAGESLPVGVESDNLPLEYKSTRVRGVTYQVNWLEKLDENVKDDMKVTLQLVNAY